MEPKLSFTIPSIHDDTVLDCRLYYSTSSNIGSGLYRARGAVIAHPYAPLGGCYDDPVVGLVVSEISKLSFGFICTFNFRGAYGSAGHTSWTGKAERADYESVVGFMIEYLRRCDVETTADNEVFDIQSSLPIQLVLGGYSYGSWICTHLPTPADVLKAFDAATEGSAYTEIKSRAHHLAMQTILEIRSTQRDSNAHHGHTLSVGGEETSPEKRRRSGENSPSRFSSDVRKSLDFARKLGSLRKKQDESSSLIAGTQAEAADHTTVELIKSPVPELKVAYLLVSPLLPPISAFVTLPFSSNALRAHSEVDLQKFSSNPTLAVFGPDDMFTSGKKLRAWAKEIGGKPASQFHFVEVEGAGHFWRSHSAQRVLRTAIRQWFESLSNGTTSCVVTKPTADESCNPGDG
ncbi:uncharacterized protein PV09_02044 [Verruconis gallopava]|uniref:AB hydrolase-1 domain-containing protein n=1 Tax=Verruconis gallopava TaxID=253628 RepID=A0A0D2AKU4_9PEZI|nr:uncharacterized protein PV09_02044 [Verruconis gallopava]KIW07175.1 hypothetical protein PV09_02044 [Verruconis gallopava]